MQIQMRVIVAIGAAYFIGYSRGVTASQNLGSQITEGLNKVGDGLTDIAVELGIEFKKYKEDKEEFVENIVNETGYSMEEKVQRMVGRPDLFRSDDQIADALGIPVEDVKTIIGDTELGEDIDGDVSRESGSLVVAPTAEEAHIVHSAPGEPSKVTYSGMSTRSDGESPDQPGSDAS